MGKKSEEAGHLGEFTISSHQFKNLSSLLSEFQTAAFERLHEKDKSEQINRLLFELIQKVKTPCFLLPAVLDYIATVNALKLLDLYTFYHFELWLNQFSHANAEENYTIRSKIVGKGIPRNAYQEIFPIGMGKIYPGSHFVTAHGSPDLDTTIASFWGWVDAFGARVSEGLHLWNIPGGPPSSQVEIELLFHTIFGEGIFPHLTKNRTALSLSGMELMTQKGLVRKQPTELTLMIDHGRTQNAVILVDEEGYYLGDWRSFDVEGVHQVIILLNQCLNWFENHLHSKLISLFVIETVSLKDLPAFVRAPFLKKIQDSQPAKDFTAKQRKYVTDYLIKVLGVEKGLESTFGEFAKAMTKLSLFDFQEFVELVESLENSSLFNKAGVLIENRPQIFHYLEKVIKGLDKAIQSIRNYVERLDVALRIKSDVFGYQPQHVSPRADVEEIKSKMGNYTYLSVVSTEKEGKPFPMGIVHAHDLYQPILGTVTLRDFCNREETKIPSYLEVISVIDHHRTQLHTASAPLVMIADAQSSNVLCAELAFKINDQFSLGGMSSSQIETQIKEVSKNISSSENKRLLRRLLQRQLVAEEKKEFFIDPLREFVEYLHFLYAILDDTDLLTKVSQRDLECVAHLLNRLKSLMLQKEVEVITLSDIPHDLDFMKKAAARILQNKEMYSLYRKVYFAKEEAVEKNIALAARGQPSFFFDDTKVQNGCARVGQAKLFARNYPIFSQHIEAVRRQWHQTVQDFYHERPEVDLHMQMISTVAGAEDLFAGKEGDRQHCDELWIWIPFTEQSIEHLKSFLNAFRSSEVVVRNCLSVEFSGEKAEDYEQIFMESFLPIPKKKIPSKNTLSIAVLKYKAGAINSRKAMISPYLPKLVN